MALFSRLQQWLFLSGQLLSFALEKYFPAIYSPKELRRWAFIFSLSNLGSCTCFFLWHLGWVTGYIVPLLITAVIIHLFIGARFINNSQKFGRLAFSKWAWLNLIFFSPLGLILLYYAFTPKYWQLDEINQDSEALQREIAADAKRSKQTFKHKKLEARFNSSLAYLKKINAEITQEILQKALQIHHEEFEDLSFFQISAVIALAVICKQCKQKTFDNLIWGAHWYEDKFFTFGFRNSKPISAFNKYPMTVGSIVLDEQNNYKKILEKKVQIKKNLSFSDAKIISLHMGDEYKLFVNQ
ncbi:hypothetical protein MHLP_04550 [Candidatus Mycoplasma haematolamae str. Purdue]|uniref:Uncharacterized protein n=1 Tax=Mycoplasma haematolamae (strain Purdue) TaxID=1212765 RepID=I7BB18_MYCHA|nr:hypothetical protein [Candidatus Mycoplasma haematolamae]AFO52490.1 hypothetical protein MHLP_04550 [Candidatus Mycoplasma haematolamae str. Purdue]